MAATIPSIIPLGATKCAPASAWLTATRPSTSSVRSLSTTPFRTIPQCPCVVYEQQHTSVNTARSGACGANPADGPLDHTVRIVVSRPEFVFFCGKTEYNHRRHPSGGDAIQLGIELTVGGEVKDSGQRRDFSATRPSP